MSTPQGDTDTPGIGAEGLQRLERLPELFERLSAELSKAVFGQHEVVRLLLVSLFARGHSLVTGVPGLAKTLLVRSLADVLDLDFNRIQFTPDLMPADITGSEVLEEDRSSGKRVFRLVRGPVFTNVLLADEINRATPRTQSALLQAMQERSVTIAGTTYTLEPPFMVLATQNPIEQEGTYALPEAQLDRFLFSIIMDYPDADSELDVVRRFSAGYEPRLERFLSRDELLASQEVIDQVPVAEHVLRFALNLVRRSRPTEPDAPERVKRYVSYGAGPRAGVFLVHAARALAAFQGSPAVSTAHIRELALPTLRHRILLSYRGVAEGLRVEVLLEDILRDLERS
jgi:MoxR-like ATPase